MTAPPTLPAYYYGDEAEQFTYIRIPCQLITHPRFKHLSTDAKLLYALLLDRMSLSVKHQWYDPDGRVYIYYTVDEICGTLTCGRDKAMKLMAELDTNKGIGLIERVKQGQGKPTKIYVRRFTTQEIPPEICAPFQQVEYSDGQKSCFQSQRSRVNRHVQDEKPDCNHIEINQPEFIQLNQSIYPPAPYAARDAIERCDLRETLKSRIDYDLLLEEYPSDDVESIVELLTDVLASAASTIRIGGQRLPTETVRQRYRRLEREHIAYVLDSMKQTTSKINNIRAYLLTALYNAPVTIGPFYSAAVRHDYG